MTQKQTEFIGFLVPEEIDDMLRLQSVLQGVPKGSLIRHMVETHIELSEWSINDLVDRFSAYHYSKWYTRYRDVKKFENYLFEAEEEMRNVHKLPERLILQTLKRCKEQHESQ